MADKTVNQWFKDVDLPLTAMAHILIEMDDRGHLEDDMRQALRAHANNLSDVTTRQIQGTASAAASALSGDGGLSDEDAAAAFWGIAAQAEKLHAMQELQTHFREHSKPAGKAKTNATQFRD